MLLTSKFFGARLCQRIAQALFMVTATAVGATAFAQGAVAAPTPGSSLAPATAPASPPPSALTHQEGLALAKARACLGCHQVDNKRVGPSFAAISQRYSDKENAIPYIVHVIRKGGRGQWGAVPMPGQAVGEQDAQKLAQWIISIRK